MVTHHTYPPPLLPHSLYHHIPMHPAPQDYCTPSHRHFCHPLNQIKFPLQHLPLPLFPLSVHLCMAPVWLLASTPAVWTAAPGPEQPKEAHHWVNTAPQFYPLAPPRHLCALILCTLM